MARQAVAPRVCPAQKAAAAIREAPEAMWEARRAECSAAPTAAVTAAATDAKEDTVA